MWWLWGKGESGFSSSSTAEEVTDGINGSGLIAIVIGQEEQAVLLQKLPHILALRGVHVIMGVRNIVAGKKVKEAMVEKDRNAKIDVLELDLSSIASVRKFASNFNSSGLLLNILINNAGIAATPFMLFEDDIELQFATNHIGHFLLTNLRLETMKKTSILTKKEGRIVNVSSWVHWLVYPEGIRFDNINDVRGYGKIIAYNQSKLANILSANDLARRFKEEGVEITANSLHPGTVATALFRDYKFINGFLSKISKYLVKDVEQGTATTCYVALHAQVNGVTGEYFLNSHLAKASSQATDVDLARKLWDFSEKLFKKCSQIPNTM